MARTTTTRRTALLATLAAVLPAGCGSDGIALEEDAVLSAKIQRLRETGESARLRDLTGGDWNSVHVFAEDVTREYVERGVGARIDMGTFWSGTPILVFLKDGDVQRAVWVSTGSLREGRYSSWVVLRAGPAPGGTTLEIVEGSPANAARQGRASVRP